MNPALDSGAASPFRDFLRWQRERRRSAVARRPDIETGVPRILPAPDVISPAPSWGLQICWAGHSSYLVQIDGHDLLLDPVWSDSIGYGAMRRKTPVGLPWSALPALGGVLVSHDHFDHLDAPTLLRLPRNTPIYTGLGVDAWFRRRGFTHVHGLDWWQGAPLGESGRITYVPAQHFSGRTPWGRDSTLWGGFVIQASHHTVYYAGDSGAFPGFAQIGDAFPELDAAIIPAGAYEPRWFMGPVHVGPDGCGAAFLQTGARQLVPCHWGTFRLADEPLDDPPARLREWWRDQGLAADRLRVPALGETLDIGRG